MVDLNLTGFVLDGLNTYGAITLGLALLLGAIGIPVPGTLLVVAAGALVRQETIDWHTALTAGLLGAVVGDNCSYATGRFANRWVKRRFGRSSVWQAARQKIEQRGAMAVYSTRFLFTPLAIPPNLIAGSSGYSFQRFFTYDVAGELTWLVLYGGLGYTAGSQWELVSQTIVNYSGYLAGLFGAGLGGYFLVCYLRQKQSFPLKLWW